MRYLTTTLFVFILCVQLHAKGIEFFHGSWEEALEKAQQEEKIIFVDAYTTWCGPCKRMSKQVFPDDQVGAFYNRHFINVKMDMEAPAGIQFGKQYPVSAYPTLFYIDYNGEIVQKVRGARQVDGFLQLGEAALNKIDRSAQYAEEYEKGKRDPDLVRRYIKSLNRAGKSSLKIANEYLREQSDLTTEGNLRIIFEAATEADSRIFGLLTEHRKQIEQLMSEEAVAERIRQACEATVDKAIEYNYRALMEEAVKKMEAQLPDEAEAFAFQARMDYAREMEEGEAYLEACQDYVKKVAKNDPAELHRLARELAQNFYTTEGAMEEAESIAKDATKKGEHYSYFLTYSGILAYNGNFKKALSAAEEALELAEEEGKDAVRKVETYLQRLKSKQNG